jgi:hypothetical protein
MEFSRISSFEADSSGSSPSSTSGGREERTTWPLQR